MVNFPKNWRCELSQDSRAIQDFSKGDSISSEALKTSFKRSALLLNWEKGDTCVKLPTISDVDVEHLKDYVQSIHQICQNTMNKCHFLSSIPSFIDGDSHVHDFPWFL